MKIPRRSRKKFIKTAAWGLTGFALQPDKLFSDPMDSNTIDKTLEHAYRLNNVRLETGFVYEDGEITGTKTELFSLFISGGKIQSVQPGAGSEDGVNAKGRLMLPAFKDMHIHLDKTFYGGSWQAARPRPNGVKGMISLEQKILPELLNTSTERAEKLIELLQSKGSCFARSHVNIEPTSGLRSLENLQVALEHKKQTFGAELVAFPQHGVFYTESVPFLKEAARMDIDLIGGLDPMSIDGAIEKTMDFTLQLALDNHKGIDIHLHESGKSGLETVEYLIDQVLNNPVLKGKTFLSHCFVLGRLEKKKLEEIAEKLAAAQIGIVSTIPIGGLVMPIPTLLDHGVQVLTGNDSIVDHWNTFGSGSVLEKANLAAQLYGYTSEFKLSRMLGLATAGLLPLSDAGDREWPRIGDDADFVLLDAECSAEAVSRISPVQELVYRGRFVFN